MTDFQNRWVNLAADNLGAHAVSCSDEFFAPMHRMLSAAAPVFVAGKFDNHGKWMDGWETRRKRGDGHDWCVVKLARGGVIHAIEIDTTHFTGNYPPAASVEACHATTNQPGAGAAWHQVLTRTDLRGDHRHQFEISDARTHTHIRINLYPDGGIARLRVFAEPKVDWSRGGELPDLAAALNGAVALACNDEHFGTIRNLLTPGRGVNMGDGWETRRRREPGHDWAVIRLAHPGVIRRVEVDTAHFKGNYPDRCSLQAINDAAADLSAAETWPQLLPPVKLEADRVHQFANEILDIGAVSHVRLNIYPDGGVSRLRLFGEAEIST